MKDGAKLVKGPESDGSHVVALEKGRQLDARGEGTQVLRKADGTEVLLNKNGQPVESDADKLMAKFKNFTPEQQHQLRQDLADIDKLPPEQRKKVYESLDRIARNDEHPEHAIKLTGQQARELVASLAHQIAHPESIQQGDKMTCVLANSEQTLARNHPEVYADMVAKLATDGKYTTPGGKTIEVQKNSEGRLAGKSDAYSQRSYASKLFQNGAAQLGMKEGDVYKSYPPGAPELNPRPAGVNPSNDTGERVVHKDGTTEKFRGFDAQQQADILNQLAPNDKYRATEPVKTPADLEKALKENGGPPLNVGIHLGPESGFTGMSGSEGASGSGYHAVNITRIETGPDGKKYVYYENPAGGTDHSYPNGAGVPIEDFVKAMQGGDIKMRAVVHGGAALPRGAEAHAARMGNPGSGAGLELHDAYAGAMGDPITLDPVTTIGDKTEPDVPGAEYKGEGIKRDVPPVAQALKPGQTFEDLAKQQLGNQPPPTREEIDKYIEEIRQLNNVYEESQVKPDQVLKLPGHSPNGDLITADGNATRTVTQDGTVKVEHYDGTSYEIRPVPNGGYSYHHKGPKPEDNYEYTRQPDGKGGYTKKHTGKRPEDNYEITKTPDGHYKIKDAKGEKSADAYDAAHSDPRVEKAKMLEAAQSMPDEMRARFYENMERFENRANKQNLSPEERARFYHELTRLIDAKDTGNSNLPDAFERHKLAEQIMKNAADPKSIDQGLHGTCGAAALESRIYTNNSLAAARMITDVATTGEFKAKDGTVVKPDPSLLEPDAEAQYTETPDGKRNYASQVFQGTAISMEPSGAGYKQGQPDESAKPPRTGETCDKGEFKGVTPAEVQDMEKKITGNDRPLPVIENSKVLLPDGQLVKPEDGQIHVGSEAELRQQLLKMKTANPPQLPAVIFVHPQNEPFFADSGGGKAGGSGAYHFVTVTDYDPRTGKVSIDKQWGKGSDHRNLSVSDLYHATQAPTPERIKELEAEVKRNKAAHKENPVLELEVLRLKRNAGQISQEAFDVEVTRVMKHQKERWDKDPDMNNIPAEERKVLYRAYQAMLYSLPEADKKKVTSSVGEVPEPVDPLEIVGGG